jgi:hypothetical protein
MSMKAMCAPAWEMASVVAMKVCGTVMTVSPCWTPRSHQGKAHGIRAAGETDAMGRVAILGKFAFELFHQGAADEARGTKNLPTNGEQFGFELDVRGDQIQERDFFVA